MPSDSAEIHRPISDAHLDANAGNPDAPLIDCTIVGQGGQRMRPGGILVNRHVDDPTVGNETSDRHYAYVRGVLWSEGAPNLDRYRVAVGQVQPLAFRYIHPYRTSGREIKILGW